MTFALVNVSTLQVAQEYLSGVPTVAVWPNGDASHCPIVGDERDGYRLVEVVRAPDSPGEFYALAGMSPTLDGATLTYTYKWQPIDVTSVRTLLALRTNQEAEDARLKYLTAGAGQAIVYLQKVEQARAATAALAANSSATLAPATYPLLAATVGIDAQDIAGVAAVVLANNTRWLAAAAQIERTRATTRQAILNAASVTDAVAAAAGAVWP